MPEFINKVIFYEVGKEVPKASNFKGKITAETLFGSYSKLSYDQRMTSPLNDPTQETFDVIEDSGKNSSEPSFLNYTGRQTDLKGETNNGRKEKNYTYTNLLGFLDSKAKNDLFAKYCYNKNNNEGSLVWECIISLKDVTTADKYAIYGQNDFAVVTDKVIHKFFINNGFDESNMIYWQDYHYGESKKGEIHPHVHIQFFEINKHRTRGMISQKSFNDLKRDFAIELAKRDKLSSMSYESYLSAGDKYRKSIIQEAKAADLKKIKDINDLYKILPDKGRPQYNSYQMNPYRPALDKAIESFLRSKAVKPYYDSFVKSLEEYDRMIEEKAGDKVSIHKENKIKRLYERIGNMILQEKKDSSFAYNKHLTKVSYKSIAYKDMKELNTLKEKGEISDNLLNERYKDLFGKLLRNYENLSAIDVKEMANMAYNGRDVAKDINKAITFMNVAISRLDDTDTYHRCSFNNFLSKLYYESGDKENGLNCLKISAGLGDNRAIFLLGIREVNGDGIDKNIDKGLNKIVDAGEKGNRDATKWLRSNGFRSNGSVHKKARSHYHIPKLANRSSKHRSTISSIIWTIEQQRAEIDRAIERYQYESRDYENYDYTL